MRIASFLLTLALIFTTATPAMAEPLKVHAAKLTGQERKDVDRIEAYLNTLKSISAAFLQVSDSGAMRQGSIELQRPGKMRVTYETPDKDFIIADGHFLNIWDSEMEQQTTIPLGNGIADFILRDKISLSKDVTITRFAYFPTKIEVSIISTEQPDEGELTLVFEDKPLKLRQWRVLDAQGRTTGVHLENAREDVTFAENTFRFIPPNLGKTRQSQK